MDLRVQRQNPERPQVESQNLNLPKSLSHLGTKKTKKQTKKKLAEINCKLNSESGDPDLKTNRSKGKEGYSLGFNAANNNSCLLFVGSPAGEAGFPGGTSGKESTCQCRRCKKCRFSPWVGKITWRRKWQPAPVFLPGKFRRQRSLVGSSPQGHRVRNERMNTAREEGESSD